MNTKNESGPIAYLVDPFPAGTGTFVLSEMEGIGNKDVKTVIFSWNKKEAKVNHELARKWMPTAVIAGSVFSLKVIIANLYFFMISPLKYVKLFLRSKYYEGKQKILKAVYFAWVIRNKSISHIHAHFAWNGASALLISKMTGVSYSCTMHASDILYVPPPCMEAIINASKFTATISNFNRNYIINHWPDVDGRKLHVVRLGIDFEKFPLIKRVAKKDKLRILTVARLEPIKQIPFHLEVCRYLRRRRQDFEWIFVGEGNEQPLLEKCIKDYGLEGCVELKGLVAYENMEREYRNADIIVLLSKTEGIPTALMEAMATGLPVIASRTTGVPELVEDGINGYLISGMDKDAATNAIIKLIESPQLREAMGKNGQKKVFDEYCQAKSALAMKELFFK